MMYYLSNMNIILTFFKKNKYIFIVIITVLALLILFRNEKSDKNDLSTEKVTNEPSYKNLIPGKSTKEETLTGLGTALNAKIEENKETYEYLSSNPNFNTKVVILDNKLSYIKVIYTIKDNIKSRDLIEKYGYPEKVLYGSDYSVGYILNTYPERGIAFISHQKSLNVREVWYFEPTTLDEFIKDYAPGYTNKINNIQ